MEGVTKYEPAEEDEELEEWLLAVELAGMNADELRTCVSNYADNLINELDHWNRHVDKGLEELAFEWADKLKSAAADPANSAASKILTEAMRCFENIGFQIHENTLYEADPAEENQSNN